MTKKTISARVSGQTSDEIEDYAEENDLSKSEAISRLLDKSLKIEHGEAQVVITDGSGTTRAEERMEQAESNIIAEVDEKVNNINNPWELRTLGIGILLIFVFSQFSSIILTLPIAGVFLGSTIKMIQYHLEENI